jgi:integrase
MPIKHLNGDSPYTDVLATMSHNKIASYLEEISKQNARTARVFKSHLGDFDRFNDGRTDDVLQMIRDGKADVYEVLRSYASFLLKKGTLSAKTIGYSVKTARRFLEYNDFEISSSKFHLKVKLPKGIRTEPAELGKADVIKIINGLPDIRIKTFVMFLASSGCRAEEALSITLGDIDLEKDPATIHVDGNFTKTKRERHLWLTEEMKRQLQVWMEYKYRQRTIKSKNDNNGQWTQRELKPQQSPADFIFLPYGQQHHNHNNQKPQDLKKTKNLLKAQRILKNGYYPLYDAFKAAVKRIGYPNVTFHSFRRFAYTTIDGLGHNQFAEFYLGHTNSPYWKKPEAEKIKIFKLVQPYLTFLDIASLEAKGADFAAKLEERDAQIQGLIKKQEQLEMLIQSLIDSGQFIGVQPP